MEIKEFDEVVLKSDVASGTFKAGTIGVVVDIFSRNEGYAIEFFAANGETLGVEIVPKNQVESVSEFPYPVRVERAA